MGIVEAVCPGPATGPQTAARVPAAALNSTRQTDMMTARGKCPSCGQRYDYEPLAMFPKVVPMCDSCEERAAEELKAKRLAAAWKRLHIIRRPLGPSRRSPHAVVCPAAKI